MVYSRSLVLYLFVAGRVSAILEDDILLPKKNNYGTPSLAWPKGKVYYSLAEGEFSRLQAAGLSRNLRRLEAVSCVRFLPRPPSQQAYIRFRNIRHRCAASIGYKPNKVLDLYIGWPECHQTGIMQHEILHGLGMWHEHTRQDRDQHITVFWENIAKGKEFNFRLSPHDKTLSLPYDYSSVMHYRAQAFSKTGNEITLLPKDYSAVPIMGQRKGFTLVDIAKLNRVYDCATPYYKGNDLEGMPYVKDVTSKRRLQALRQRLQANGTEIVNMAPDIKTTVGTTGIHNDSAQAETVSLPELVIPAKPEMGNVPSEQYKTEQRPTESS